VFPKSDYFYLWKDRSKKLKSEGNIIFLSFVETFLNT